MFSRFSNKSFSTLYTDEKASASLSNFLFKQLKQLEVSSSIHFICVGTDRSTGDCFGPLIGEQLKHYHFKNFIIHGDLNQPIHALNIKEVYEKIQREFPNEMYIGIDASLGKPSQVGHISIHNKPLKPGSAMKKVLPSIGTMHITGTVNIGGFMEFAMLQNTRLNLVMRMAQVVSDSIVLLDDTYHKHIRKELLLRTYMKEQHTNRS